MFRLDLPVPLSIMVAEARYIALYFPTLRATKSKILPQTSLPIKFVIPMIEIIILADCESIPKLNA